MRYSSVKEALPPFDNKGTHLEDTTVRRVRHQVFDMHESDDKGRTMTQSGKLFIAHMTTYCVLRPANFWDVQLRHRRSTFSAWQLPVHGGACEPSRRRSPARPPSRHYEMPIRRRLRWVL
jgi:hypothetical protein